MATDSGGGGQPPPTDKDGIKVNPDQSYSAKDNDQGNETTQVPTSEKRTAAAGAT